MFESAVAFNHDITGWTHVTTSSTEMFKFAFAWLAIYSRDTGVDGPASAWSLGSQYCGEDERARPARAPRAPPVRQRARRRHPGRRRHDVRLEVLRGGSLRFGRGVRRVSTARERGGRRPRRRRHDRSPSSPCVPATARKSTVCSRLLEPDTTCATCDIGYRSTARSRAT